MRKFTRYPQGYVKADSGVSSKSVLCTYDSIIPILFDSTEIAKIGGDTDAGFILTGVGVPTEFDVDLTGDMLFNEFSIVAKNGRSIPVSTLSDVLSWLDANNLPYDIDEYGLIVGGSQDGRIDDNLNLFWVAD